MRMHWRVKAAALAALSTVPFGVVAYKSLQRVFRTNRLDPREGIERALQIVDLQREHGKGLAGCRSLEIGTGWRPYIPFVLQLAGGNSVTTVDVNPWLTKYYAFDTFRAIEPFLPLIADRSGVAVSAIQNRYDAAKHSMTSLADLLAALNITYLCPQDAQKMDVPDGVFDLVCSSNVLEHVPPEIIAGIHRETARVLSDEGTAVHRFNPADHFSFVDRRITSVNFLRFSESKWHRYGGNRLAYHNRLRCPEHRAIFGASGLQITHERLRVDSRALTVLEQGQLPLADRFKRYSPEELAVDYMWVVARPRRLTATLNK